MVFSSSPAVATGAPSVYWGAYVDGVPWDSAKLAAFEKDAGKGQSIIHFGGPWSLKGVFQPFPMGAMYDIRQHGSIPMVTWLSWDQGSPNSSITNEPAFTLRSIYTGQHDAYIRAWAQGAKTWGHPFFLRFDHEMNGWWSDWSEKTNGNRPGDYVKAWRHVHDIFDQEGATNVTWVWTPNWDSPAMTPLAELYPGGYYVDWVGADGYNWGGDRGNMPESFSQIFGGAPGGYSSNNTYQEILNLSGKPFMVAETATSIHGATPAAWVTDTLSKQIPLDFTAIKAIVWMNWDAGDPTLSWPIDSSTAEIAAFKSAIASPVYASNTFGNVPGSSKVLPLP